MNAFIGRLGVPSAFKVWDVREVFVSSEVICVRCVMVEIENRAHHRDLRPSCLHPDIAGRTQRRPPNLRDTPGLRLERVLH